MLPSHGTNLPQSAKDQLPKVVITFLVGMISVFIGALIYSQPHHSWGATRSGSVTASQTAVAPKQYSSPLVPDQRSTENSTEVEEQQTTATSTSVSPPSFRPISAPQTNARPALISSSPTPEQPVSEWHVTETQPLTRVPEPKYLPPPPDTRDLSATAVPQSAAAVLPETHVDVIPEPEPKVPDTRMAEPKVVTVQPGTSVQVRLAETLSSDRNRTGDTFRAVLDSPLVVDGFVVAGTDSTIFGRVTNARKAPFLGGKANLTLTLTNITTTDGRFVRIDTNDVERDGSRSGVVNTAKMAGGAAVGAVIGALTGAAEGAGLSSAVTNDNRTNGFMATNRTVALPPGTRLSFSLASPLRLSENVNR
ncbi:MAG: hypothetical protein JO033_20075 [Acidobacteriaceae bacterium]|nr:hypothetical protein [Acidobacteriaceae bacterium]MBV9503282.1 hypothetical protein [Acidobacteriaceae bacterium]